MDEVGFWELIDRTRPDEEDPAAHAAAITEALVAAGVDATRSFASIFDTQMDRLCTWDLWGAGYFLLLGCSDDAFEYLRCWVIARGRDATDHAVRDPEGFVIELVADCDREEELVIERIEDLWILNAEPVLYAAGLAHEQLTGDWLPATGQPRQSEPRGERWDEDDLPERFERLAAALPDDWYEHSGDQEAVDLADLQMMIGGLTIEGPLMDVLAAVQEGMDAFDRGDHQLCCDVLGRVVDDPERWAIVASTGLDPVLTSYAAGMSRFICGDPDGAARALALGVAAAGEDLPGFVRRGVAQVHLARGDLEGAGVLLDEEGAPLIEDALRATLHRRRGDEEQARTLADHVLATAQRPGAADHPWDLAGIFVQIGFVFADLGDGANALVCADFVEQLVAGAPDDLPLHAQGATIRSAALRLNGDPGAATVVLDRAPAPIDGTCDLGLVQRERARLARAAGDEAAAREAFALAETTLRAAGERWLADAVAVEAAG